MCFWEVGTRCVAILATPLFPYVPESRKNIKPWTGHPLKCPELATPKNNHSSGHCHFWGVGKKSDQPCALIFTESSVKVPLRESDQRELEGQLKVALSSAPCLPVPVSCLCSLNLSYTEARLLYCSLFISKHFLTHLFRKQTLLCTWKLHVFNDSSSFIGLRGSISELSFLISRFQVIYDLIVPIIHI